jgi:hypothetical protein
MSHLLQKPYAYPEKTLTRGEVAKLICNHSGVVPMRNEQVFSDVPLNHPYSRYIWAMNELGIMMGNGDGTFRPDSELSMQEFAVMAVRVAEWIYKRSADNAAYNIKLMEDDPVSWPPENERTK